MAKMFDSFSGEPDSFEAFKGRGNRYSRDHTKLDKATQAKLDRYEEQTDRLSRANLALTALLKRVLPHIPTRYQAEYDAVLAAIKNGTFEDVHP